MSSVQLAGNAAPFTVTIILAVCQLAGVLTSSVISDKFGRRWLTLGLFGSGTLAILAIGILGSFDYQSKDLGSVLVSYTGDYTNHRLNLLIGIFRLCVQLRSHWGCWNCILLCR